MSDETLNVKITTKDKLPRLSFLDFKNTILGKKYELSILFAGESLCRKLNKQFRDKDYATNILSFPLSETSGEIVINLKKVRKDALEFERSYENFLAYLLIHGMLHLKGYDHGSTMDSEEIKYQKKLGVLPRK